ncbi:MAG: [protein-PII] uridylyltransferase [Pirellulales bacterium]
MSSSTRLPQVVLDARDKLALGREKLRRRHEEGSPGIQLCAAITELLDSIVLDLYRETLATLEIDAAMFEQSAALIPYGGYGRRDTAPYSDVDLMLLHAPGADKLVLPVVRRFTQHVFDVGLQLGFSARTTADACQMGLREATIFTSLAESRLLVGNETLFAKFAEQFRKLARRRGSRLIPLIDEARRDERRQFGETNYLLEPHVKRSRGGLRDIQLVRWVGFVRCGEVEPENLMLAGVLAREDYQRLQTAREFLLRLRNELHFHAGKAQDVLNKSEQLRLAQLYGYPGDESVLPVEQLMRDYFKHTSDVRYIASNFLADSRPVLGALDLLSPLVSYKLDRDFRVGPRYISVTSRGLSRVSGDPAEILRLMELANLTDKRIEHRTWSAIRESMLRVEAIDYSPELAHRFMALLAQPARLGELLRRLHELRVLEKLIPPLAHARHLMQFNDFHKFTVDEHSIRAVECATEFRTRNDTLGEVYRGLRRKDLLHLALLLHDLGKGYAGDHSEVGRKLSEDVGRLLALSEDDVDILKFLVHKHLIMSHLAQWRDTSDDAVVVKFAVEMGTPDRLQQMYLLTCADLAGVGPNVLTDWKLRLLTELYQRTMRHLAGDPHDTSGQESIARKRIEIRSLVKPIAEAEWWNRHLQSLPRSYLLSRAPEEIVAELERLRGLGRRDAVAWSQYDARHRTTEYTVGTYEDITAGVFHKLTGAISSQGLRILSAEINTLGDGLVLDRFMVEDPDYADAPPPERSESVHAALVAALKDETGRPPAFRRVWGAKQGPTAEELEQNPTVVRIDTQTSDRYTIIDVFALDQLGLLYAITRTLFELGLNVGVAKIGTHLDQVVDVFYVTDQQGRKVVDDQAIKEIRQRIYGAIEELQRRSSST